MSENNGSTLNGKQRAFLAAYAKVGTITAAAEVAQVARRNHAVWMQKSEEYRAAFEEAKEEAFERLEAEARRRALEGTPEPVFYQGRAIGAILRYSDSLLKFILQAGNPQKYRDHVHHSGSVGLTFGEVVRQAREKLLADRN